MTYLLKQVVDSLKVRHAALREPFDDEYVAALTDVDVPHPLLLINGADYRKWVGKYGLYFAPLKETGFVCVESKPLPFMLSLISLASGIPEEDLLTLSVCRQHFEALCADLNQLEVRPDLPENVHANKLPPDRIAACNNVTDSCSRRSMV
ncbi:MAG TPA: hypothetical protein VL354_16880 [Spirochaetia bacterium]|nr:hypothetical protein [Spirochaetia bacterium]